MPRPPKCRKVCRMPVNIGFTPLRTPPGSEVVVLTVDEYECIRLIDKEGYSQEECGNYMAIARTTVQQIYTDARRKLARALVEGLPFRIQGGHYRLCGGEENQCGCIGCPRRRRLQQLKERGTTMKIAIPLDENKEQVCVSFGRAPFFLIWTPEGSEILENPAAEAPGGAGLQAAQFVMDSGASALVTVRCGENAAQVLQEAGIAIYKSEGENALENARLCGEDKLRPLTHFHAGYHGLR